MEFLSCYKDTPQGPPLHTLPPPPGYEIINYLSQLSHSIPVYVHDDVMSVCVTVLLFSTSVQLPQHTGTGPKLMGWLAELPGWHPSDLLTVELKYMKALYIQVLSLSSWGTLTYLSEPQLLVVREEKDWLNNMGYSPAPSFSETSCSHEYCLATAALCIALSSICSQWE